MNEFDARKRDPGSGFRLETEHGSYPSFDTAMILLDGVVYIFAGADRDGSSTLLQPVLSIALYDGRPIGLATIDGDPFWAAMTGQSLADKAFGRFQIAISAEIELNRFAVAVDGTIKIHPLAFDLYIGLIQVPFTRDLSLPPVEELKQFGTEMQNPAIHSRVIDSNTALSHHFLQITQAQIVSKVPSHTQKNNGFIEMTAFEHR